ncbi:MAG: HD domain-containing protein [Candidatus Kuenenia sp.]|nr:HD domain-containing protein [Candidatus Kuenenia hertensis]
MLHFKMDLRHTDHYGLIKALVEGYHDIVYVKDSFFRYLMVNSAFSKLVLNSESEIIGKKDTDLFPEGVANMFMENDLKTVASKEIIQEFDEVVVINEKTMVFRTKRIPYCDEKGKLAGIVGIMRNVAQERQGGDHNKIETGVGIINHTEAMVQACKELKYEIANTEYLEKILTDNIKKLHGGLMETIRSLANAVEERNPHLAGHQKRVTKLAVAIAIEMYFSEEQIEAVNISGLLHDIGNLNVPYDILSKPYRLSEAEFSIIKHHPEIGHDVLKDIDFPIPVATIVLQHHESMDGSGYPSGISGDKILKEARVLKVADTVEAMVSERPHRPSWSLKKALLEITVNKGIIYDADVVDACFRVFNERGFQLS